MPIIDPNLHIQRLERLVEVCRDLGKSEDVEHLLQKIVNASRELTGSQFCFLFVYEQETDLLKIAAGPLDHRETLSRIRIPIEKSLTGWVYTQSRPTIISNPQKDPRIFRDMERVLRYTTQSLIAVPLIFRGQTIGVLEAINKRDSSQYNEDDLMVLDTLASQAAVATLSTILFEETKNAHSEAQQLDQMKNNFIAIASHELRTPLGLVLGHATFLRELVSDEQQKSQIEIIIRNATRLKSIIEELASVNGFQMGTARAHIKTISINSLIQNIYAQHIESAKLRKISIHTTLLAHDLRIEGDEEKLEIALSNLIKNALIFTNPGGNVFITIEPLPGYVQITVADDGIGIPESELTKIFERFYQVQSHLTRRHGGMGLGLSVAKAMIEMHNGQIWAESDESRGSKFFVLLPLTNGPNPNSKVFHN